MICIFIDSVKYEEEVVFVSVCSLGNWNMDQNDRKKHTSRVITWLCFRRDGRNIGDCNDASVYFV